MNDALARCGSNQPGERADQLQAAVNYLVDTSTVRNRIDRNRLAVAGHSMGGGGSIEAARDNAALQAVVAFQPWHTTTNWSGVRVPTMIHGAENDSIAPVPSTTTTTAPPRRPVSGGSGGACSPDAPTGRRTPQGSACLLLPGRLGCQAATAPRAAPMRSTKLSL